MRPWTIFTKKDVVIVLFCLAFLLVNLGALGNAGRQKAMEAVCMSNLKQWGHMFQMYLADNDNTFMLGDDPIKPCKWFYALAPYYGAALQEFDEKIERSGQSSFLSRRYGFSHPKERSSLLRRGKLTDRSHESWQQYYWDGSYGSNSWIYVASNTIMPGVVGNWKTSNVSNTDRIPVLLDSAMFGGRPEASPTRPYDLPPLIKNDLVNAGMRGGFMKQFCIDRHNGSVNALFMDWSVRPVGLKELWTLTWHRGYNTCNQMTMCGNRGSAGKLAGMDERASRIIKNRYCFATI